MGAYIYGDWSTGRVWGIKHDGTKAVWHRELVDTPFNITGFGTDHAGELYVIDQGSGFYRLEPTTEADRPSRPFPTRLSQTGLFASVASHKPHPAALMYEVNAPQWADGATIERFAALTGPGADRAKAPAQRGGRLDLARTARYWFRHSASSDLTGRQQGGPQASRDTPPGSAAGGMDRLFLPLERRANRRRTGPGQWQWPRRSRCPTRASRAAVASKTGDSRRAPNASFATRARPASSRASLRSSSTATTTTAAITDNQLRTLEHIGVFQGTLPRRRDDQPRLVNPYETRGSLEARVKSYLHVNCSTCHVSEGGGNCNMELGLDTPVAEMKLINEVPAHSQFDIVNARLVAAGSPERSVLYHRISRRGTGQMPPLGSTEVDQKAVNLIADWIRGLPRRDR